MRRRPESVALLVDEPYASQEELLSDVCLWLDALLAEAYARDAWVGRDPQLRELLGLVVTREEFEEKLAGAGDGTADGPGQEAAALDEAIQLRMARTQTPFPYLRALRRLRLDELEERALRLCLATELDAKYEKLFGYLQDDVTLRQPSLRLCARLCAKEGEWTAKAVGRLRSSAGLAALLDAKALEKGLLAPAPALVEGLFAQDAAPAKPEPGLELHPEQVRTLRTICRERAGTVVLLCGEEGCGRRTALEGAAEGPVVRCTAETLGEGMAAAALGGALLAVDCREGMPELERLPEGLLPVFLLAGERAALPKSGPPALRLRFGLPGDALREELFAFHARRCGVQGQTQALAAKFFFTPGRIAKAMEAARVRQDSLGRPLSQEELHQACYDLLDLFGQPEEGGLTLEDLVLPRMEKRQLLQAVDQVLLRRQIYESWGFGRGTPYGRGVSILLSGPPGTGKTMAARIVARQLHMRLLIVQLPQVISKYVGETEKNLRRVFEQASQASAVLFFDECDALFGKRAEVRDAQDRHANAEVAFLLKQMEDHDGVTLLATNLSQNIDAAFMRRMRFVVHFPFPDQKARESLYRKMLPSGAPVEPDVDFAFLAEKFALAGGNIKNIVLHAAFLAARENRPIGMRQLLRAAVYEQRKNQIVVVREELRQYADLMDDEL